MNQAILILQLINTLEPAAVSLIQSLLQGLQGKTTEQILAEANTIWQSIIDTANAELNGPVKPV